MLGPDLALRQVELGRLPAQIEPLAARPDHRAADRADLADQRIVGPWRIAGPVVDLQQRLAALLDGDHRHGLVVGDADLGLLDLGGGEQFEVLQRMAQELGIGSAVCFCGRIKPEKVALFYHAADVSVDPVFFDNTARGREPLKLFESWACGIPFVTGDVGDRRMLASDPPAILLAQPGNPDSFAEAIQRILKNPDLADTLRQRGYQMVQNYYWDKLAGQLEVVYRNHIKGIQ